jgi:hypothetical protein
MAKQDKRRRDIFAATIQSTPLKIEETQFDLVKELQDELSLVSEGTWF